ncbi:MAG TPA: helix-hairpin-helix domain-containing protein [Gammaproteobacteria bacterium]|jgi:competence protein ComEA|nr:helix-hairpin-helix domain-containing protein [Gammaproteobacteria bacterium]HIK70849.1 helix-hairpin-helix domain-containing protein [Pseudomonadales bacterium]
MEKWIIHLLLILGLGLGNALASASEAVSQEGELEVTVDINSADAETLAVTLEGIGATKAVAIVRYRDQYGRFFSAEELTAVKGIGHSTVEKNRARIVLD